MNKTNYDVILVAGQSNTHYGLGYDSLLDASDNRIVQLGRFDENDHQIIPAAEPLDHHTKKNDRIGFALTFAKLYADAFLVENRKVLIIPCGRAGSGFKNNRWNPGDFYYEDAVERTQFVLRNFKNSKLVAILWQQGEDDVTNPNYQAALDQFMQTLRNDLGASEVPFILGGMVPGWVEQASNRIQTQAIIKSAGDRFDYVGYADPLLPIAITQSADTTETIHYDAAGLRELGSRYFGAYVQLKP